MMGNLQSHVIASALVLLGDTAINQRTHCAVTFCDIAAVTAASECPSGLLLINY